MKQRPTSAVRVPRRISNTHALIFFLVIIMGLAIPLGMLVRMRIDAGSAPLTPPSQGERTP